MSQVENGRNQDWVSAVEELRRELSFLRKFKADRDTTKIRFEGSEKMQETIAARLTETIADVKSDVSKLSNQISKRSSIQLGSIVALIGAIVGGAAFIINMTSQVETNTQKVETNTKSVKVLTTTVKETMRDVQTIKENGKKRDESRVEDMKSAFRVVLDEKKWAVKPKLRTRRNE
jgi:archaellum component FlaC